MDDTQIKHVLEAALLAAGRPLTLDRLAELFTAKDSAPDRATLKRLLEALAADYEERGIELKEVASGYRVQIKRSMSDWLQPLWEERAPRYTRALLETLALIAYRQPITRAEIEEVRGVVVSTNIVRTLLERNWIRVVGHRDVPGKPAMFGTTKEFLDYFGLKKLEDLPPLSELKDVIPELSPQTDLIDKLEADALAVDEMATPPVASADEGVEAVSGRADGGEFSAAGTELADDDPEDDEELDGPDIVTDNDPDEEGGLASAAEGSNDPQDNEQPEPSANVIPLRAGSRGNDETH